MWGLRVISPDGKEERCLATLLGGSVFENLAGSGVVLTCLLKFGFFLIKMSLGLRGPLFFALSLMST